MRDSVPSVMYCVNGESSSSLLIESTDSMIYGIVHTYLQPSRQSKLIVTANAVTLPDWYISLISMNG